MNPDFDRELEERLLRYAAIDTQSDEASPTSPSTERQLVLLRLLRDELEAMGAADAVLTPYGAVLATLPGSQPAPTIAFLAHVDTAPQFNATGVKPVVHRAYDGGAIAFPDAPDLILSPEVSPYLAARIGDDIVTASGATLLGADDKAGVAIIMTLARHLLAHPEIAHGPIRIAFTPDEEIGRGVHADLPRDLAADVAYTLDGAERGEIVFESFSADKATIRIEGVSIHPGVAKGKLVNALHLAAKIVDTLPHATLTPETTSGREGFLHVYELTGTAAAADLHIILRDFERDGLAAHGALIQKVCAAVQAGEPRAKITCTITPQYRNMRYWLEKDMRPVELALEACRQTGLAALLRPGPRRHRRLPPHRDGHPLPQPLHRHAGNPRPPRMGSVQDMAASVGMCLKLAELWGAQRRSLTGDCLPQRFKRRLHAWHPRCACVC